MNWCDIGSDGTKFKTMPQVRLIRHAIGIKKSRCVVVHYVDHLTSMKYPWKTVIRDGAEKKKGQDDRNQPIQVHALVVVRALTLSIVIGYCFLNFSSGRISPCFAASLLSSSSSSPKRCILIVSSSCCKILSTSSYKYVCFLVFISIIEVSCNIQQKQVNIRNGNLTLEL